MFFSMMPRVIASRMSSLFLIFAIVFISSSIPIPQQVAALRGNREGDDADNKLVSDSARTDELSATTPSKHNIETLVPEVKDAEFPEFQQPVPQMVESEIQNEDESERKVVRLEARQTFSVDSAESKEECDEHTVSTKILDVKSLRSLFAKLGKEEVRKQFEEYEAAEEGFLDTPKTVKTSTNLRTSPTSTIPETIYSESTDPAASVIATTIANDETSEDPVAEVAVDDSKKMALTPTKLGSCSRSQDVFARGTASRRICLQEQKVEESASEPSKALETVSSNLVKGRTSPTSKDEVAIKDTAETLSLLQDKAITSWALKWEGLTFIVPDKPYDIYEFTIDIANDELDEFFNQPDHFDLRFDGKLLINSEFLAPFLQTGDRIVRLEGHKANRRKGRKSICIRPTAEAVLRGIGSNKKPGIIDFTGKDRFSPSHDFSGNETDRESPAYDSLDSSVTYDGYRLAVRNNDERSGKSWFSWTEAEIEELKKYPNNSQKLLDAQRNMIHSKIKDYSPKKMVISRKVYTKKLSTYKKLKNCFQKPVQDSPIVAQRGLERELKSRNLHFAVDIHDVEKSRTIEEANKMSSDKPYLFKLKIPEPEEDRNKCTHRVVRNLSGSASHRKLTALMGTSGAGKSTLMKLLTGQGIKNSGELMHGEVFIEFDENKQGAEYTRRVNRGNPRDQDGAEDVSTQSEQASMRRIINNHWRKKMAKCVLFEDTPDSTDPRALQRTTSMVLDANEGLHSSPAPKLSRRLSRTFSQNGISSKNLSNKKTEFPSAWTRGIAFVEQHVQDTLCASLTIEQTLVLYARFYGTVAHTIMNDELTHKQTVIKKSGKAAARLAAKNKGEYMFGGETMYATVKDRKIESLSGGQLKLVGLAVALLSEPLFLVVDEPTSGLDSKSAEDVVRKLKMISHKYGVLFTIHQPSEEMFEQFDDLCLLKQGGRIDFMGPASELSEIKKEEFIAGYTSAKEKSNSESDLTNSFQIEAIATLSSQTKKLQRQGSIIVFCQIIDNCLINDN